jgi:pyridoxamine 5'-phosphate oxidase-like protein
VGLERARELGAREDGLAIAITLRNDGSPQASVVNAGIVDDPVTGNPVVGFVARGGTKKLAYLRARPRVTVVFRSGWEWVAVEGEAGLAGPDDALEGSEDCDVNRVIRSVYAAAVGGTQEEWAELDAVIAAERHAAVLVRPSRIYSNPGG